MISTFYLAWWQIVTQYCTITQSTLLMKPCKCHSAAVYALCDITAPGSRRREYVRRAGRLWLCTWSLTGVITPAHETQTMLQCSPPAQSPGCLVRPVQCKIDHFLPSFAGFLAQCKWWTEKHRYEEHLLPDLVRPDRAGYSCTVTTECHSGAEWADETGEREIWSKINTLQTMVRANGSPGVI